MTILSIGNFGYGWDSSICDEEHIAQALERAGHKVIRWQREEVGEARNSHLCDFILIQQWDGFHKDLMNNLNDYNSAPIVYWAFDHQDQAQEWHQRLIWGADLYLSKRVADSIYQHWQWLSQDFAPPFLGRVEGVEKNIDVLFTGSYLPWATERNETLLMVQEKFNLEIHSINAWPEEYKNVQGPVMDDALPGLIARAKINLSIDHTLEAGYWSDRNAQIMACGGLVLFRYVPLSEATFRDELVYFYDKEDCLGRIEQLLERNLEDLAFTAERGYNYAHNYLMVDNRVRNLLTIVESIL